MTPLPFKVPAAAALDTPLAVARHYIAHGVPVFPAHEATTEEFDPATGEFIERPEKSPRNPNGLKGASRSERIIGIWFEKKFPTATIGVPTGESLGAWVLDLDRHGDKDGHVWLAAMEQQHGPLPDTARARTANNGTHIFFAHEPDMRNRAEIAPGADTRAEGGYILAPGSVMADGRRYEWIDADGKPYEPVGLPHFAPAPAWLLDMLKAKPAPEYSAQPYSPPEGNHDKYVEAAIRGEMEALASTRAGRNQAINQAAFSLGTLVGAGVLSRADAEAQIMAAAHANGYVAKDGERAARQTMKSGMDSGVKSPRRIETREANDNTRPVDTRSLIANGKAKRPQDTEREHYVAAEQDAPVQEQPSSPGAPTTAEPRKKERFELTWFDQIEEGKPKETIVKGVLGESEFTVLSGLPGTGKSVIVTDMACHIAANMPWHGRRVRTGLVIYIAAERKKLTERRMMAFRKHHGVQDVPLLVVGGRLDLTKDLADANALVALIKEAELATGLSCVLVIIDTLTRTFGAGDQNTSKDMTRFVQSCDQVLADTKAHVLVIHHTAWAGERMKGAIDLDGAVDATFLVKKSAGGKYALVCNGTNDGEEGDLLAFKMESVVLGLDEDGEPTTAPVVVPMSMKEPGAAMIDKMKGVKAEALASLRRAVELHGIEPSGDHFPDGIMVVSEEQWREVFYADQGKAPEVMKKAFQRGRGMVGAAGSTSPVWRIGEWYWPA